MTNYVVTVIDTAGIQPYIFSSNRLRENIGASYLVDQATGDWVKQELRELSSALGIKVYVPNKDLKDDDALPRIQKGEVEAELVYSGGGNTVLLFTKLKYAQNFLEKLSRKILEEAPGLRIIAAHREFDWGNDKLQTVISELIDQDISEKKQSGKTSSPLLGLSVTASCNSTQLVAIGTSEEFGAPIDEGQRSYPVSREVSKKLSAVGGANRQLKEIFTALPRQLEFPYRFDHLGRTKDEFSYIAVVHADGNSMGDRFKKYGELQNSNESFIKAFRLLSQDLNKAGQTALKEVLKEVKRLIDEDYFELPDNHQYFPFRPLVYGGDDVTFVCDGRLGLVLAAKYLDAFEQQETVDKAINGGLTACAGVSIIKTHYPFARAYKLSEALCSTAKRFVRDSQNADASFSALDWHIATTGLIGSIEAIREREYCVGNGSLTLRPIRLKSTANEWRTWEGFQQVVDDFCHSPTWKGRRNKVIALRDVLRKGPVATQQFLQAYRLKDQKLPSFPEASDQLAKDGWLDGICGYFDAIEVIDYYPYA